MIDICHVESGVKILLTVLLVNCHVVSGKILDFRISRQTGLKSPFKWHKQSGKTKWRTFQQVLRYVTPSSIPPANIQSTWAKSNIVRKSFQGDVLPICGSSTQKVCLFQSEKHCVCKHCDGEVPTCRPPRFQRQQLRELLIPPLSHCHYHQHYPPLPLHLIPPLPLPPPLSLQFLSALPLHLLPPLLLLPPLSLNYCHFYHHHYHCYYIYFSTKIYRSPTAITGTFKVDHVIF